MASSRKTKDTDDRKGSLLLLGRQAQASEESKCLETVRDTLFPKLLSSELRIREAERIVEAAT